VTAVYVYGVAPAAEEVEVGAPGIEAGKAGVRRLVHRDLAALVSDVEEGPLVAARGLRAHWKVLEEAVGKVTVLPVRFGTIMESDEAVVEQFLAPRHDQLVALLAELSGKVQLSVKAFYDEERLLRGVLQESRAVAQLRQRVRGRPKAATYYDRIQLGELVAGEVEQARERDTALVIGRLQPLAVAARSEPPGTPDAAVNAAFLVERSRVDEFSEAVARLAEEVEGRMRVRYIGPVPPYGFTEEQEAVGAWA
jgi:Gas vesicle synthesis protein GvpL/GvpF